MVIGLPRGIPVHVSVTGALQSLARVVEDRSEATGAVTSGALASVSVKSKTPLLPHSPSPTWM